MANELTSLELAPIQDGNGANLWPGAYSATSSDPLVASIGQVGLGGGAYIVVNGLSAGTATITATRNVDGATATLDVTVTSAGAAFTIQLGTPSPR